MARESIRNLPSVHQLLDFPQLVELARACGHTVVVDEARRVIDAARQRLLSHEAEPPEHAAMAEEVHQRVIQRDTPKLRPVINATGILLHTGLGRAPHCGEAVRGVGEVAQGYASVEVDLVSGERSKRVDAVAPLLRELTGAERAHVVNNNTAATVLALAAIAAGKEVIVSRGELIEIGGNFRLPDVMQTSGAILREVGTTNKTRLSDYAKAINERTGALLLVHPSNYAVVGFSEHVSLPELVALGHKHNLPVIHDVGSGSLLDLHPFGFKDEPLVPESISQGADLVLFSGDKLLGGPQCGILVGKKNAVQACASHPLARAFRVDKMILAALEATLRHYRDPQQAIAKIPLLQLLSVSADTLKQRALRIAQGINAKSKQIRAEVIDDLAYLGGGSVPTQGMATWCVALIPNGDLSVNDLASRLRQGNPSVFGRIKHDQLRLDLRTVFPAQDNRIVECVHAIAV